MRAGRPPPAARGPQEACIRVPANDVQSGKETSILRDDVWRSLHRSEGGEEGRVEYQSRRSNGQMPAPRRTEAAETACRQDPAAPENALRLRPRQLRLQVHLEERVRTL